MIIDEEIDEIGFALEEGGLSHSEIDEYFEHFGVKGMHWGSRKEKKPKIKLTPKEIRDKNKRIQKRFHRVLVGAALGSVALGVGANFVGELLPAKKNMHVVDMPGVDSMRAGQEFLRKNAINVKSTIVKNNYDNLKQLTRYT